MEANYSYVDYNRAGVPLVEIVSYPDIESPDEAVEYLMELRLILIYLGVSTGNMEEGALRCDANVSIEGHPRCEVKNMNSFKSVKRALEYEIERQMKIIKEGGEVVQETRHFNESDGKTYSMRGKEEAEDYRYFPDPDLPPLVLTDEIIKRTKEEIGELPNDVRKRLKEFSLSEKEVETLVGNIYLKDFYFESLKVFNNPKAISNWLLTEVLGVMNEKGLKELPFTPKDFASSVKMFSEGKISSKILKKIIKKLFEGKKFKEIIEKENILPITSREEIRKFVLEVLKENEKVVNDYKRGKENALTFLIGQVMRKTKGRADPKILREVLLEELKR